jgi:carbonic anhydrase
VHIPPS